MIQKKVMFESAAAAVCLMGALLAGCGRSAADFDVLAVSRPDGNGVDIDALIEEYRVVPVHSDSLLIGELVSVVQRDSVLYSLDAYGTLVLTSLNSEKTIFIRNLSGQGPGECIQPQALAVDSNYVYVYDLGRMSISCYSVDSLEFKKQIQVDVPSMSIAASASKLAVASLDLREGAPQIVEVDVAGGDTTAYCHIPERCEISYALAPPAVYAYGDSFFFTSLWNNVFNEIDATTGEVTSKLIRFDGFSDNGGSSRMSVHDDSAAEERPVV
ncbi:MAG: 6-bladed beta-propeller, partial [Muribaculaceae bacterium]|nr:6-bladed beta-propeller [Muribaculaceae bacterium]